MIIAREEKVQLSTDHNIWRTASQANILCAISNSFSDNFIQDAYVIFQNSVDDEFCESAQNT